MIKNILFVCIGNICRSPMAEGLFRQAMPEKHFFSAGLNALVGEPPDPHAIHLLRERGIDIGMHRARNLEGWMVMESDLILTMDQEQKQIVELRYRMAQGKVVRIAEYLQCDIPDPYRRGRPAFGQTLELLCSCLEYWTGHLRQADLARPDSDPRCQANQLLTSSP